MQLHHIDGNKKNDKLENLVFLMDGNHGIITKAQEHYNKLAKFFEEILKANIESIKKGIIPE